MLKILKIFTKNSKKLDFFIKNNFILFIIVILIFFKKIALVMENRFSRDEYLFLARMA